MSMVITIPGGDLLLDYTAVVFGNPFVITKRHRRADHEIDATVELA